MCHCSAYFTDTLGLFTSHNTRVDGTGSRMRFVVQGEDQNPEEVLSYIFLALVSRESCNPVAHLLKDDYCNML